MARNGRQSKSKNNSDSRGLAESRMARNLDSLAEFDLFNENIMPQLKRMVLENWPPDKIRKAFAPLMQARMIQAGLIGRPDSTSTQRAIRDTLDRHEGTAVQRVDNVTRYGKMDKRELAALAIQKLLDAKIIDTTGRVIKNVDEEEPTD